MPTSDYPVWRVALCRDKVDPGRAVPRLALGEADIRYQGKHHSFIHWLTERSDAPPRDTVPNVSDEQLLVWYEAQIEAVRARHVGDSWAQPDPIDMVLHCPACGYQHIDKPSPCTLGVGCEVGVCYAMAHDEPEQCDAWDNPPHRTHLCLHCKHTWRPADVPTNGVLAVRTQGSNDAPIVQMAVRLLPANRPGVIVPIEGAWKGVAPPDQPRPTSCRHQARGAACVYACGNQECVR